MIPFDDFEETPPDDVPDTPVIPPPDDEDDDEGDDGDEDEVGYPVWLTLRLLWLTLKFRAYGVDYYWRGQHILTSGKNYIILCFPGDRVFAVVLNTHVIGVQWNGRTLLYRQLRPYKAQRQQNGQTGTPAGSTENC